MSSQNDLQRIIGLIKHAFADQPYPGDEHLVSRNTGDSIEVEEAFQGKSWQELNDVDFLVYHHQSVFNMTPEAYRYYLPAYLLALCRTPRGANCIWDSVIFSLTPERNIYGYIEDSYWKRMEGLTAVQFGAIKQVLAFLRDSYPEFNSPEELTSLIGELDYVTEKLRVSKGSSRNGDVDT